ncbi:MAG: hypothetical protein IT379_22795 [Deltaproteobacteria bacterium]|nr:hypothetical protein [Deltaproteobacteria bacterium]
MQRRLSISEARKSLFALFRSVTANTGSQVILSHRTSAQQAVLVSKEYVERLELVSRRGPAHTKFRLFGSGSLLMSPDDVVDVGRREQAALFERKLRSLGGPLKRRKA